MRETDGYQYVFMLTIFKYCATKASVLSEGHQVFRWGVLTPLLKIPFVFGCNIIPMCIAVGFRLSTETIRGRCPWYVRGPL